MVIQDQATWDWKLKKKRGGCVGRFPEPWMISYTAWCTAQHVTSGVQLPKELQPFPFCPMQRTWKLTKWNWATENIETRWVVLGLGGFWCFCCCYLGFLSVLFSEQLLSESPSWTKFCWEQLPSLTMLTKYRATAKKTPHSLCHQHCIPNRTLFL